jgi:acetyl esterase
MPEPQAQMRAVLAQLAQGRQGSPHRYTLPFPQARAQLLKEREPWLADGPACTSQDLTVHVKGRDVGLRVTQPVHSTSDQLLMYLHGGGWCVGSPQTHDNIVRRLATEMKCKAWSIDYALAPEAAFPQGLFDVLAMIAHAKRQHPTCHLTLAGDSAGANLALAATLLQLHHDGATPVDGLLLFYGVYGEAYDDASMAAFGDGRFGLSLQAQQRYMQAYLGEEPSNSPYTQERQCSFPLTSGVTLHGLPPVWMTIAELDILRDQNRALSSRLRQEEVDVHVHEVPGVTHGFLSYGLMLDAASQALSAAAQWERARLRR